MAVLCEIQKFKDVLLYRVCHHCGWKMAGGFQQESCSIPEHTFIFSFLFSSLRGEMALALNYKTKSKDGGGSAEWVKCFTRVPWTRDNSWFGCGFADQTQRSYIWPKKQIPSSHKVGLCKLIYPTQKSLIGTKLIHLKSLWPF